MTLHTQQSFSGFIASEPQQSLTEHSETRFYARVGQPHFRREDDGRFTALTPTFHDLVAYRATADRALTHFAKGDSFVAEGYVRTFEVQREGTAIQREEFVAKKIGHDLARTSYAVDRARRAAADAPAFQEIISQELVSATPGSAAN
ncbi:single-stranded DNA-binding protein [Cryobacterium melibiosiphilum]|uniref:Single-stranded DNA-binding protein n=1 Tax=Cryobacterium melibiosiphilum TaxID=995039 RepID=A0A3A5N386_9MICO|nr:single-stranded DNA-binding protein [Cryobacterium melibiosiphilum]RJT91754.1 single-stranded DNA-binding protein [Cryobacterium melibiosiphilum]